MAGADRPSSPGARGLARTGFGVGFLLLLGFFIWSRRPFLAEGLWRDEAAAVYVAQSPSLSEFFARHRTTEYTPPLFNLLVAIYGGIFGFGEQPLKAFALGLGLLSLAGIAVLAAEVFGAWAALGATLLAVNNPILAALSAELRPYSLSVALAAVSLTLASRLARQADPLGWRAGVPLAVSLTILAFSHVAGALTVLGVGAVGLWALGRQRWRGHGRILLGAAVAAGAAFSLWLPMVWSQFRAGLPYESPLTMQARGQLLLTRLPHVLPDFGGGARMLALVAIFLTASVASKVVRAQARSFCPKALLLFLPALVVIVLLGLFSRADRYLAIPAALFAVLAAGLFDALFRSVRKARGTGGGLLAGIVLAALSAASFAARTPFYRELRRLETGRVPKSGARTLCRDLKPGSKDFLVAVPDYLATTLWYYCGTAPALKGIVLGENALLLDWREYRRVWSSPRLIPDALELIERHIAAQRPARLLLVRDATAPLGTPLGFPAKIKALRRVVESRYVPTAEFVGRGRVENIEATEFRPRLP